MAHYNITNLNFITSGKQRSLVNIDYELAAVESDHLHLLSFTGKNEISAAVTETGPIEFARTDFIKQLNSEENPALATQNSKQAAVLNEQQYYPISAADYPRQLLRLYMECDKKKTMEKSIAFNQQKRLRNQTFQFEKIEHDNNETWAKNNDVQAAPMYDLMDLCVRSSVKKIQENTILNDGENVSQYMTFQSQPVAVCQSDDGNAVVITSADSDCDYVLNTSLRETRNGINDEYTVDFKQRQDAACLYLPKSSMPDGINSVGEYLDMIGTGAIHAYQYFEPEYVLNNIKYNKFIQLDQNTGLNPTDYESGDTYGDFFIGKNHLDPQYSMNMNSMQSINKCRTYCGAHKSNKYVVLKYYDDSGYKNEKSTQTTEGYKIFDMAEDEKTDKLPYQKIEFFMPVNNSAETGRTFHKSNLFSVRISGSNLNNSITNEQSSERAEKVKTDIKRMVREIAENICPATTQLFEVYIDD